MDKTKKTAELAIANKELFFQNEEKEKRAKELIIANKELAYQYAEKEKRAGELIIANQELAFQNKEKEKRAAELIIVNKELAFQNAEKEERAAELIIANKELVFQNEKKEKRAAELSIANKELSFQNCEKEKRAAELSIANIELVFQNEEKEKRAAELSIANKELAFQNKEKEKRAAELSIANIELAFQNEEKEKRAVELGLANIELAFQNEEKEKRATELSIANKELAFQNKEKEKRAGELTIANIELAFQKEEKEKRAAELIIANEELAFQNAEKEKLVEKQSLFESIVNSSNDAILSKNLDGIIITWNPGAEKVFGYSSKEIIGKHISIIIPVTLQNEESEIIEKTRRGEIIDHYETERIRKDGKSIYVSITISPIKDLLGNIIGASKIAHDITQRKKTEEELSENIKQLESANKELESFSYSVSHDLRAPLRAIHGYARMLKENIENKTDTEANRLMNNIITNVKRMGLLIDDLLTFSRLGRKELVKSTIPMNDLVTTICTELKNEQEHRDIEFHISELLPAQADNIAIKQVWLNLISNAIKYSKLKDKAIIQINSELKEEEIIYSIKDNGVGFDMRYANKLFGVFQRLHSDEEFEGTGVGLAIVQRIVSKHGGRVWAESKINEGATFFFTLNKS
jgi:PAS domain S-box-containing protein